jgi:hypothetical protein
MHENLKNALKNSLSDALQTVDKKEYEFERQMEQFDKAEKINYKDDSDNIKPKAEKPIMKVKKDSFCFPESDYELIDTLRQRYLENRTAVNKSEILRIGLNLLMGLSDKELIKAGEKIEKLKAGKR